MQNVNYRWQGQCVVLTGRVKHHRLNSVPFYPLVFIHRKYPQTLFASHNMESSTSRVTTEYDHNSYV